jgi:hypothetical protein
MVLRKRRQERAARGKGRAAAQRTPSASPSQEKHSVRLPTPTNARPPVDSPVRRASATEVTQKPRVSAETLTASPAVNRLVSERGGRRQGPQVRYGPAVKASPCSDASEKLFSDRYESALGCSGGSSREWCCGARFWRDAPVLACGNFSGA